MAGRRTSWRRAGQDATGRLTGTGLASRGSHPVPSQAAGHGVFRYPWFLSGRYFGGRIGAIAGAGCRRGPDQSAGTASTASATAYAARS